MSAEPSSQGPMLLLRSIVFQVVWPIYHLLWFVLALPALVLPRRAFMRIVKDRWARWGVALHSAICGVRVDIRGRENLPEGAVLVAAKHQSAWETLALAGAVPDPVFILKRELMRIPLFGWYLARTNQVPIDRGNRDEAMRAMNAAAKAAMREGRQLLIFPEGTRRAVGAEPAYKWGVAHLYLTLEVPCVPVALNSGVVWPRRGFLRPPGLIVMEFLPPITPGLSKEAFFERLTTAIETRTEALVAEGIEARNRAMSASRFLS